MIVFLMISNRFPGSHFLRLPNFWTCPVYNWSIEALEGFSLLGFAGKLLVLVRSFSIFKRAQESTKEALRVMELM